MCASQEPTATRHVGTSEDLLHISAWYARETAGCSAWSPGRRAKVAAAEGAGPSGWGDVGALKRAQSREVAGADATLSPSASLSPPLRTLHGRLRQVSRGWGPGSV